MSKKETKDLAKETKKLEEKIEKKSTKKDSASATLTKKKAAKKMETAEEIVNEKPKKRGRPKKEDSASIKVAEKVEPKTTKKATKAVTSKSKSTETVLEISEDLKPEKKTTKKSSTSAAKKSTTKTTKTAKAAKKVEKEPEIKEVKEKAKTTKKATSVKKTTKKASAKKTTASRKKSTSSATKKTSKTKKSIAKKIIRFVKTLNLPSLAQKKHVKILEYFDLPYRYNETVVKILAQTPKTLFVYWDISDYDREQYILNYGENFFNDTYPVLLVKNETYGYVEEIPINDFANSWYLHIKDARSTYSVELGRKYKNKPNFESPYIYVKNSNQIIAPNDRILIDELKHKTHIKYKNAKTNEVTFKNITNVIKDGKILDFYSLYQVIYNTDDLTTFFNLDNPSSGNPTSTFK